MIILQLQSKSSRGKAFHKSIIARMSSSILVRKGFREVSFREASVAVFSNVDLASIESKSLRQLVQIFRDFCGNQSHRERRGRQQVVKNAQVSAEQNEVQERLVNILLKKLDGGDTDICRGGMDVTTATGETSSTSLSKSVPTILELNDDVRYSNLQSLSCRDIVELLWGVKNLKEKTGELSESEKGVLGRLVYRLNEIISTHSDSINAIHPQDLLRILKCKADLFGDAIKQPPTISKTNSTDESEPFASNSTDESERIVHVPALFAEICENIVRALVDGHNSSSNNSLLVSRYKNGDQASLFHTIVKSGVEVEMCYRLLASLANTSGGISLEKIFVEYAKDCSTMLHGVVILRDRIDPTHPLYDSLNFLIHTTILPLVLRGLNTFERELRGREFSQISLNIGKILGNDRGNNGGSNEWVTSSNHRTDTIGQKTIPRPSSSSGRYYMTGDMTHMTQLFPDPQLTIQLGEKLSSMFASSSYSSTNCGMPNKGYPLTTLDVTQIAVPFGKIPHLNVDERILGKISEVFEKDHLVNRNVHSNHIKSELQLTKFAQNLSSTVFSHVGMYQKSLLSSELCENGGQEYCQDTRRPMLQHSLRRLLNLFLKIPPQLVTPQDLSTTVWTMGKLACYHHGFWRTYILDRKDFWLELETSFTWQGVALVAYGAGSLVAMQNNLHNQRGSDASIYEHSLLLRKDFWQNLGGTVVKRLQTTNICNPPSTQNLPSQTTNIYNPPSMQNLPATQNLANILWAFGSYSNESEVVATQDPILLGVHAEISRFLFSNSVGSAKDFPSVVDLIQYLWASAKMQVLPSFKEVEFDLQKTRNVENEIREAINAIYSLSILGYELNESIEGWLKKLVVSVVSSSSDIIAHILSQCTVLQISNLFWCAMVQRDEKFCLELKEWFFDNLQSKFQLMSSLSSSEARQIYSALCWLEALEVREERKGRIELKEEAIKHTKSDASNSIRENSKPSMAQTTMIKTSMAQTTISRNVIMKQLEQLSVLPLSDSIISTLANDIREVFRSDLRPLLSLLKEEYLHDQMKWTRFDFAIPTMKIAFEVNGPSHYCYSENEHGNRESRRIASLETVSNPKRRKFVLSTADSAKNVKKTDSRMNGPEQSQHDNFIVNKFLKNASTILKERYLEEVLGWKYVEIPYFEWRELRNRTEKTQYITAKLKEACKREACTKRES